MDDLFELRHEKKCQEKNVEYSPIDKRDLTRSADLIGSAPNVNDPTTDHNIAPVPIGVREVQMQTPLVAAVRQGDETRVQQLITQGQLDPQDAGIALCCAINQGDLEIIKMLRGQGVQMIAPQTQK